MEKNFLCRTSTSSLNWSVDYFRADGRSVSYLHKYLEIVDLDPPQAEEVV